MFYLNPISNMLHTNYAPNFLEFPDEFLSEYFKADRRAAGFVVIENDGKRVTACRWDEEAYQAWAAEHPAPDLLAPAQAARQEENKTALADWLKNHPLSWVDGNVYGVTEEDQTEMALNLQQYQIQATAGREVALEWHTQKKQCHTFTVEQYNALLLAIIDYVYPYRRYQEQVKEAIYSAKTVEEVMEFVIDYESVSHG